MLDSVGSVNGSVVVIGTNTDVVRAPGFVRIAGGSRAQSDYVEFPSGLVHSLTNVTIELWATPRAPQTWSRLFDFGPGNNTQTGTFFLSLCRGSPASLSQQRFEYGNPTVWTIDSVASTTASNQYHYVVTWTAPGGTNLSGTARWYRNTALVTSKDTGAATIANVNDTVLWLGRSQYTTDNSASADYNEVRIYDHILSQAQINANFTNGPDTVAFLPPVAADDSITLNPGAMALLNVLQNDQGVGAPLDPATVTLINPPAAGSALVKPGGKILYTHNGSAGSSDQFGYRVSDSAGGTSQVATVFITIDPGLRLPNTTMTIPNTPPAVAYQVVDAFPGLTFEDAVAIRSAPNSTNRIFVVERRGIVSCVPDINATNPVRQVFLDIRDQVQFDNTAEGESGLLGLEFHPGFATNGLFYVGYVAPITKYPNTGWATNSYDRFSRFNADPTNFTVATNTQQILFSPRDEGDTCNCVNNHNGSDMHFGPDGYLYISMGDEGSQYNQRQNSQRIDKDFYSGILRIDVDKKPGSIEPKPHSAIPTDGSGHAFYSIPPDNPFVGATNFFGAAINTNTLRAEFFAVGLRHPWRFSVDTNGDVWVGDVGQDRYEEVDIVTNGGNYGWAYYEGTNLARQSYPTQPTLLTNPPPGLAFPLWLYPHTSVAGSDPQYNGNSISGGVVYHGDRLLDLNGAYVFGDFESANLWALRRTNSGVVVQRLAGDSGMAGFGIDPGNGDVLIANYLENRVKRLIRVEVGASSFPATLSDAGIFADLATLTPNPGIVNYEPIVAFWSDFAIKRRWFTIPDLTNKVTFARDANWSFPAGMKWIKHFDLETERGNPATKKRIETRVLVKTVTGVYGVSYKWNDAQTEAFLVGDGGTNFNVTVQDGTNAIQQQWEIPSRTACLVCHTPIAGHALSFNTREMNQSAAMNGVVGNQIATLDAAGYFTSPVPDIHTLPAFATAANATCSLEYRVRSYLAVNCVQCHQPAGAGPGTWDARPFLTLAQTGLINGQPSSDGGDPANKLIVSGDTNHSIVLRRLKGDGFSRMPPLATHQLDQGSIDLLTQWIGGELTNHLTFAQWQIANFGSTNNPTALADADPDGDGAKNYVEYLTGTNPQDPLDVWKLGISISGGTVNISYVQVPNLGVLIETSGDLYHWTVWNIEGNQPFFGSSADAVVVPGPLSPPAQYFRARFIEP